MATKKKMDPLTLRILIEIAVSVVVLLVLIGLILATWVAIAVSGFIGGADSQETTEPSASQTAPVETTPPDTSPEGVMNTFMAENGLTEADYPAFILESYTLCADYFGPGFESRDFLLNYPLKKDNTYEIDISDVDRSNGVPLFLQWDERWGYNTYGTNVCGISGCGPTSLSMVAYYLTGNTEYTPAYMVSYASRGGYTVPGVGTDWSLFSKGAVELGFKVEELPCVERTVARRLEAGIPVVITVGPGTFTANGHFMVLVGYENGMFRINDPNSPQNSQRLWSWDEFSGEVKNFWAISNPTG